ncbi:MAG: 1-deoxy-D-xylulose-5-phosphate reductoisomerase [Muribaculum sp.]|nr:1-deoxy-D-xylulose-5-phosphate reductoisomerase [Muribaculaceae bacterium]MCM1080958.1 1-deoxy-D-xylulose-5-phosphate reductoisomerase [Muribaculum sp.]
MMPQKRICVLGSTGSIGTQTLDIINEYPDKFKVKVLVAGSNVDRLIEQSISFKPELAVIADKNKYNQLKEALAPYGIETAAGEEAVAQAMEHPSIDVVVTAAVGYSGLIPTIHAIKANKQIALANKETLVVAGQLVTELLKKSSSEIVPVDSEHSAIYQSLVGEDPSTIRRLIITASGGPFRKKSRAELENVGVKDALSHPNWSMGAKITIDSASMMNKAFEIIEARWLFNVEPEKIKAVVHPQSIVHSMVEFCDGAVKAQLGLPDMHLPIRYALGHAKRLSTSSKGLCFSDYSKMEFYEPDTEKFPLIKMGHYALSHAGNTACIINAANEIAVAAFLHQKIKFLQIQDVIEQALSKVAFIPNPDLNDYISTNDEAREVAESIVDKLLKQ